MKLIQTMVETLVVFLYYMFMFVFLLISVAFFTLMEQKVLGLIQIRLGPNYVGYWGYLQSFADAVKLLLKETSLPFMSTSLYFFFAPVFALCCSLFIWLLFPFLNGGLDFDLGLLYFLSLGGLSVFPVFLAGWSSNSKYSLLGSVRSLAQMISYEVSLAVILLIFIIVYGSFNINMFYLNSKYNMMMLFFFPMFLIWFGSCLAETSRTPFDFSEGESELVSGFNTEYSSGGFILFFISEYANIIFMSLITCFIFLISSKNLIMLKVFMVCFLFIWVRGTIPRTRYDMLMNLAWKSFLPVSLFMLCYYILF